MWEALLSIFIVAMIITQAGLVFFTIACLLYQALFAKADELGRFLVYFLAFTVIL